MQFKVKPTGTATFPKSPQTWFFTFLDDTLVKTEIELQFELKTRDLESHNNKSGL